MPDSTTEFRYPCDNCGASLQFSPGQQKLKCPYCGHMQEISPGVTRAPGRKPDTPEGPVGPWGRAVQWDAGHKAPELREIPLQNGLRIDRESDLTETLRTMSCPNCGAKIEITSDQTASLCPFCATPVVMDTGQTRQLKPQGVLPFQITEAQAKEQLERWLKGLWFAPSGLTAYARRGRRMSGVYSPFWTFDADTRSAYTGERGDIYYETQWVTMNVNGKTQRSPQQVQKVRWSRRSGQVARHFNDVLILASTSLPRAMTDGLAPWDLSSVMQYTPEYLSGFTSEGYTVALADGHVSARDQMSNVIQMDVRRDIGGNMQRIHSLDTDYSAETFKHILLPVWTAAYRYNNKSYRFVVNGQSGRVQGERPWSVWKIALAVIAVLLAVALFMAATQARSQEPTDPLPGTTSTSYHRLETGPSPPLMKDQVE